MWIFEKVAWTLQIEVYIQENIAPLGDFVVQEKADHQRGSLLLAYGEDGLQVCRIISVMHKFSCIIDRKSVV